MATDYRDLALSHIAADEADLREDVARYRLLAVAAIDELHAAFKERDRLREQHHRLLDEYRHLRAQTMRGTVPA